MAIQVGGFEEKLNELTQQFFADQKVKMTLDELFQSGGDLHSYIFPELIRTFQRDIISASEIFNYLSWWDEAAGVGGIVRDIGIWPTQSRDPVNFATGAMGRDLEFNMPEVHVDYHSLKVRVENTVTITETQLMDSVQMPSDLGIFTAAILQALAAGMNDSMYAMYKELIHKAYTDMPTAAQTALTITDFPSDVKSKQDAIDFVTMMRDYVSAMKFAKGIFNENGLPHMVDPARQVMYIDFALANRIVDNLKLDHYMGDVDYSNTLGALQSYWGIGRVQDMDDFGGLLAYGDTAKTQRLYPIFRPDGSMTRTYAATPGGTTAVPVLAYATDPNYNMKAVLAENDWARVRITTDKMNTFVGADSGGYTNVFRYTERLLLASAHRNSLFFKVPAPVSP